MDITKVHHILEAVLQLERGGVFHEILNDKPRNITGWQIAKVAKVSRPTTYRYLPLLVKAGFLIPETVNYHDMPIVIYRSTWDARDYCNQFVKLL